MLGFLVKVYCVNICFLLIKSEKYEFTGWIDPDSPEQVRMTRSYSQPDAEYTLVMSDEFEVSKREFSDGDDPVWTALDKSDDDQTSTGRRSLHYYNSSNVFTKGGKLHILTTDEDTHFESYNPYKKKYQKMKRTFKSGHISSFSKFCYTGGILEVDIKLPGDPFVGGLWPAVWILGNLGRATYESSTNKMWPWSYDVCNRDMQRAQEISACSSLSHYSMHPFQGRGATEIDLLEVMPGLSGDLPITRPTVSRPYVTSTLQVAPGISAAERRPLSGTRPDMGFTWYQNLTFGENVSINPFFYGTYLGSTSSNEPAFRSEKEAYQADALGAMRTIDASFFTDFHKFRLEWQPGNDGYIHFYIDGDFMYGVEDGGIREKLGAQIPQEPSYLVMNTAISNSWGFPDPPAGCNTYDCKVEGGQCGMDPKFCSTLPATMEVESVRVWQNKNDSAQTLGCNPEGFPTARFIKAHQSRYMRLMKDKVPLKEVMVGGGDCRSDADCGFSGKRGRCTLLGGCRCAEGTSGPHCRTRAYKNDFPDWDLDPLPPMSLPTVSAFFAAAVLSLGAAAAVSVFVVIEGKRYAHGQVDLWKWL